MSGMLGMKQVARIYDYDTKEYNPAVWSVTLDDRPIGVVLREYKNKRLTYVWSCHYGCASPHYDSPSQAGEELAAHTCQRELST